MIVINIEKCTTSTLDRSRNQCSSLGLDCYRSVFVLSSDPEAASRQNHYRGLEMKSSTCLLALVAIVAGELQEDGELVGFHCDLSS